MITLTKNSTQKRNLQEKCVWDNKKITKNLSDKGITNAFIDIFVFNCCFCLDNKTDFIPELAYLQNLMFCLMIMLLLYAFQIVLLLMVLFFTKLCTVPLQIFISAEFLYTFFSKYTLILLERNSEDCGTREENIRMLFL